jgi:hypothetical protein
MSTGAPAPGPEVRQRAPSGKPLPVKQVGKQLHGASRVEPKTKAPPQPKKDQPKDPKK